MTEEASRETVNIREVAYPGKGVGRLADGCVVFVHGVAEGEEIEVGIERRKKNYAEGRVEKILKASPHRISPECPLANVCPGCRYQHVRYEEELRCKQAQLIGLFRKLAGMDIAAICGVPQESTNRLGYRNKITLHPAVGAGTPVLGYLSEDNTSIFDVPDCPLGAPEVRALIHERRSDSAFMNALKADAAVVFRYTAVDGAVCWTGRRPMPKPWLTETTALGPIHVPRGGFFQVNRAVADNLLDYVTQIVRRQAPDMLADIYCGVGMFALAAHGAGVKTVAGIDVDEGAIEAARANATKRGWKGAQFAAGPARELLRRVVATMGAGRMMLVVDPPRMGLERGMIGEIQQIRPADIVYVSCAPDTLARDAKMIKAAGYELQSVRLFDMFPRTPYFETVAHFHVSL